MTVDVKVPVLAESIPDATLLEWRKQPGDQVDKDEILIELETDKVVLEVPAPEAGVLIEVLKHTGDTVLSKDVLARIDSAAALPGPAPAPSSVSAAAPANLDATVSREHLSPAVRRLVDEHDLDPSKITGAGKNGRITKGDVLAHLEAAARPGAAMAAPAPAPGAGPRRTRARRVGVRPPRRTPRADVEAAPADRGTSCRGAANRRDPDHLQ